MVSVLYVLFLTVEKLCQWAFFHDCAGVLHWNYYWCYCLVPLVLISTPFLLFMIEEHVVMQAYKDWLLRTIEETWNLFHKKFTALWDKHKDGSGEAYLPAIYNNPQLQQLVKQKFMSDLFHDTLGFGAAKMIRWNSDCLWRIHSTLLVLNKTCQFFLCCIFHHCLKVYSIRFAFLGCEAFSTNLDPWNAKKKGIII